MKNKLLTMLCIVTMSCGVVACGSTSEQVVTNETSSELSETTDTSESEDENGEEINSEETDSEEIDLEETDLEETDSEEISSEESEDVAAESDIVLDPVIIINGVTLEIGEDLAVKVDSLGDYQYESAPSCLGAGEDKTYTFGSVYIYTRPEGARDNVFAIEVDEGGVLANGLVIGKATADDVVALYGDLAMDNGDYFEYEKDGVVLDMDMEDGIVTYAEIYKN